MSDQQRPSSDLPQHEGVGGHTIEQRKPADTPVFNCIVYLAVDAGGMRARVANLPGLECTAAGEREALGKIVTAFKQRVAQLIHSKTPIPWIEPPLPAEPTEQKRFVPVHL
jgi:hypothetical protein